LNSYPRVACLCPTYGRPKLLANLLAQFLAQDYPADRMLLVMLEDAGLIDSQRGENWILEGTPQRCPSMPAKYDRLVELACAAGERPDILVVMDDDDVYLPWHVSQHVAALANGGKWSHPRHVWSDYTGKILREDASGRFHACAAYTLKLYQRLGGWQAIMPPGQPNRIDFDQMMLGAALRAAGEPRRPDQHFPPSFVFRWATTGATHAQVLGKSPADQSWYDRVQPTTSDRFGELAPAMDQVTESYYRWARLEMRL